jgi:hypothetical protein
MSVNDKDTAKALCGQWMPRKKTTCARMPGHAGPCMTAENMALRKAYRRNHRWLAPIWKALPSSSSLPRRGRYPHPLPATEQARVPEGRQPRARPAAGPGERANAQLKAREIER